MLDLIKPIKKLTKLEESLTKPEDTSQLDHGIPLILELKLLEMNYKELLKL